MWHLDVEKKANIENFRKNLSMSMIKQKYHDALSETSTSPEHSENKDQNSSKIGKDLNSKLKRSLCRNFT